MMESTFPTYRRKITAEQRLEIRRRYRAGDMVKDIAADFDVVPSAISYHIADIREERPKGKPLKPCGTRAAYQRHRSRGERIDDACRAANNQASIDYTKGRARNGERGA